MKKIKQWFFSHQTGVKKKLLVITSITILITFIFQIVFIVIYQENRNQEVQTLLFNQMGRFKSQSKQILVESARSDRMAFLPFCQIIQSMKNSYNTQYDNTFNQTFNVGTTYVKINTSTGWEQSGVYIPYPEANLLTNVNTSRIPQTNLLDSIVIPLANSQLKKKIKRIYLLYTRPNIQQQTTYVRVWPNGEFQNIPTQDYPGYNYFQYTLLKTQDQTQNYISQPYGDPFATSNRSVLVSLSRKQYDFSDDSYNFFVAQLYSQAMFNEVLDGSHSQKVVFNAASGVIYQAPSYWDINADNLLLNKIFDITSKSGIDIDTFNNIKNLTDFIVYKQNSSGNYTYYIVNVVIFDKRIKFDQDYSYTKVHTADYTTNDTIVQLMYLNNDQFWKPYNNTIQINQKINRTYIFITFPFLSLLLFAVFVYVQLGYNIMFSHLKQIHNTGQIIINQQLTIRQKDQLLQRVEAIKSNYNDYELTEQYQQLVKDILNKEYEHKNMQGNQNQYLFNRYCKQFGQSLVLDFPIPQAFQQQQDGYPKHEKHE